MANLRRTFRWRSNFQSIKKVLTLLCLNILFNIIVCCFITKHIDRPDDLQSAKKTVLNLNLALFNLNLSFHVPFYLIEKRVSHEYVYDLTAQCVSISTKFCIKNQHFLVAIPRNCTIVMYKISRTLTSQGQNLEVFIVA